MKHHTNTTKRTQYVAGKLIRPGETREVPDWAIPDALIAVNFNDMHDLDAAPAVDLVGLLKNNVGGIASKLGGVSLDDLDALIELESAGGSPRKGVLEAIAAEKLTRAARENTEG